MPAAPSHFGVILWMVAEAILLVVFATEYAGATPWYWQNSVTDSGSGKLS